MLKFSGTSKFFNRLFHSLHRTVCIDFRGRVYNVLKFYVVLMLLVFNSEKAIFKNSKNAQLHMHLHHVLGMCQFYSNGNIVISNLLIIIFLFRKSDTNYFSYGNVFISEFRSISKLACFKFSAWLIKQMKQTIRWNNNKRLHRNFRLYHPNILNQRLPSEYNKSLFVFFSEFVFADG